MCRETTGLISLINAGLQCLEEVKNTQHILIQITNA